MVLKINSDYFHKQAVSAVQILVFVIIQLTYLLTLFSKVLP